MARVISFEERALANLRDRLGAAEEANQDIDRVRPRPFGRRVVNPCRGACRARGRQRRALLHVVTQEWPLILRINAVALALIVGDQGFRADGGGVQQVDPKILTRQIGRVGGVECARSSAAIPLFGPACELIRAEALVRIDGEPPLPSGLLALGQRAELSLDARHGSELLVFLGGRPAARSAGG